MKKIILLTLFVFSNCYKVEAKSFEKIGYGIGTGISGTTTLVLASAALGVSGFYLYCLPRSVKDRNKHDINCYIFGFSLAAALAIAGKCSYHFTKIAYEKFKKS